MIDTTYDMDDLTVYTFVEQLSAYEHRVLCVCITTSIIEAGKKCEQHIGKDPWKQRYVGCVPKFTIEHI